MGILEYSMKKRIRKSKEYYIRAYYLYKSIGAEEKAQVVLNVIKK